MASASGKKGRAEGNVKIDGLALCSFAPDIVAAAMPAEVIITATI